MAEAHTHVAEATATAAAAPQYKKGTEMHFADTRSQAFMKREELSDFCHALHTGNYSYQALLKFRNTPNENTGTSPAEKMFGRSQRTLLPETCKPGLGTRSMPLKAKEKQKQYYTTGSGRPWRHSSLETLSGCVDLVTSSPWNVVFDCRASYTTTSRWTARQYRRDLRATVFSSLIY